MSAVAFGMHALFKIVYCLRGPEVCATNTATANCRALVFQIKPTL